MRKDSVIVSIVRSESTLQFQVKGAPFKVSRKPVRIPLPDFLEAWITGKNKIPKSEAQIRSFSQQLFQSGFPEEIQLLFQKLPLNYGVILHLNQDASRIPWEWAQSGDHPLFHLFRISRDLKSRRISFRHRNVKAPVRILLIGNADREYPWLVSDLDTLNRFLHTHFHDPNLFSIVTVAGKRATRIAILRELEQADIVHYTGVLHIGPTTSQSGFLLGDQSVLTLTEINRIKRLPTVFYAHFASEENGYSAYLAAELARGLGQIGIPQFVYSLYPESFYPYTTKLALHFYQKLLGNRASISDAVSIPRMRLYAQSRQKWLGYYSLFHQGNGLLAISDYVRMQRQRWLRMAALFVVCTVVGVSIGLIGSVALVQPALIARILGNPSPAPIVLSVAATPQTTLSPQAQPIDAAALIQKALLAYQHHDFTTCLAVLKPIIDSPDIQNQLWDSQNTINYREYALWLSASVYSAQKDKGRLQLLVAQYMHKYPTGRYAVAFSQWQAKLNVNTETDTPASRTTGADHETADTTSH